LALLDLGLCETAVIAEPRYRPNTSKAARDALLDRPTIHLAPTWRLPDPDETGTQALILPVCVDGFHNRTLSLQRLREDVFAGAIADLVAIPLDGSRPLSMTGHTLAVGSFNVASDKLRVQAGGANWIERHLTHVRQITADTPGHLVPRLHMPFPAPDDIITLLVEPQGLEWRVTAPACVIPHAAREVMVLDSPKLAELIDTLMRRKERTRPLPVVRGPKAAAA
jgi:hypothetical protein